MRAKERLQKYLSGDNTIHCFFVTGVLPGLIGVLCVVVCPRETAVFLAGTVLLCMSGYRICTLGSTVTGTMIWLGRMEREGNLQAILDDFQNAEEFLCGTLRMGQEWCFGKGTKVPISYREITRVYQEVHRSASKEERYLMAVTGTCVTKRICRIPRGAGENRELNRIIDCLMAKHPDIQLG